MSTRSCSSMTTAIATRGMCGRHGRRFDVDEHELDPAIVVDGPLPVDLPPRSHILAFGCRHTPTVPGESDVRVDQVLMAAAEVDSRRK